VFVAVEVLCWAGLAALLVRGSLFGASVAMLCLLPAYVFGPGNEMTSRGGLAPLAVLAVAVAAALLARPAVLAGATLRADRAAGLRGAGGRGIGHRVQPAPRQTPLGGERALFGARSRAPVGVPGHHGLVPLPRALAGRDARRLDRGSEPRPVPPADRSPPCWPRGGVS
jgi:hypothetical protein